MGKKSTPMKSISKAKLKEMIAEDKVLTVELAEKETKRKRIREQIALYMVTNKLKRIEETTSMRSVILIQKSKSEFIEEMFLKLTKIKLWAVCSPVMKKVVKLPDAKSYYKSVDQGDPYIKIDELKEDSKDVI